MNPYGKSAFVGAFILGALALGVIAILFFGGSGLFHKNPRVVVFFHESVAGLEVGAPVTFHGVTIGQVQSLTLQVSAKNLDASIPVILTIDTQKIIWENQRIKNRADFERLVRAGFCAQLALQSLVTNQLRIDLAFRPGVKAQTTGLMPELPEIPTIPSEFDQIKNSLAELPLRELTLTALQTLSSLEKLANSVDAHIGPLARSIKSNSEEASQVLRRADILIGTLDEVTAPRSPFRGNIEAIARDMAASASALRGFSQSIERDPSVLLKGRSAP